MSVASISPPSPCVPTPPIQPPTASSSSVQLQPFHLHLNMTMITNTSCHPTITTQMNTEWMHQYINCTQTPSPAKPPVAHHFYLILWIDDAEPMVVHCIQDCPNWPKWSLDNVPLISHSLGLDSINIDLYDTKHHLWCLITHFYIHTIAADSHIFLHCH